MAFCLAIPALAVLGAAGPIKAPNVAGGFYPADPKELARQIEGFLRSAKPPDDRSIGIAIAPHAGYAFSAPVAAHTFKALAKNRYSTIVILGPSHFFPFEGAAIWPKGGLQTPLGTLAVDEEFAQALMNETAVVKDLPEAFDKEHSIEVELPFIQKTFGAVKIVPLLLGQPDFKMCETLAMALNKLIAGRSDILVLISSDMSHYHSYNEANAQDAATLTALKRQDITGFWEGNVSGQMQMCGFVPVTVGMMLAKLRGLSNTEVLKYANSGDTSGDKTRVVGYGSVIFYKPQTDLTAAQKKYLLALARQSIEKFVTTGQKVEIKKQDSRLNQVQGAFVTIMEKGRLRGCIGNIIGQKPLVLTVRDVAIAAASQDPRFKPVGREELKHIDVEISVLSVPVRIRDSSEIVLGRDGVIISDGGEHQGVFLPQVAQETHWSKEEFLSELCSQKAGLKPDCWMDPQINMYTFTANVFKE